jgi:F0F1-type ATP synthase assembly protein I
MNAPRDKGIQGLMHYAGIGFELIVTIGLLAGIGYGVDRWQGWWPTGTLVGLILGVIIGMINMIRSSMKALKDSQTPGGRI